MTEVARALPAVTAASEVPVEGPAAPDAWAPEEPGAAPPAGGSRAAVPTCAELRRAVGAVLLALSRRAEPAMTAALERAQRAWDQADTLQVIDDATQRELARLRHRLTGAVSGGTPAQRAVALEGALAVDVSVALVRLFERRLATLLRSRLRSPDPALLPQGRPFLDLARGLAEAAEAWR